MTRHGLKKLRCFILLFMLSACSTMTKPDLPRLYQQSRQVSQPPVILIHGIMGLHLVEEVNGISEIRLWPRELSNPLPGVDYGAMMLEPGDGIVTKASLLARESLDSSVMRHRYIDFPLDYPLFLCEKHDALTGNETFQDNLLHALLSLDPPR